MTVAILAADHGDGPRHRGVVGVGEEEARDRVRTEARDRDGHLRRSGGDTLQEERRAPLGVVRRVVRPRGRPVELQRLFRGRDAQGELPRAEIAGDDFDRARIGRLRGKCAAENRGGSQEATISAHRKPVVSRNYHSLLLLRVWVYCTIIPRFITPPLGTKSI